MRVILSSDRRAIERLVTRDQSRDPRVAQTAARIVNDVRKRGDAALRKWTRELDRFDGPIEVSPKAVRHGWNATPRNVRQAIALAARHIRRVAEQQLPRPFTVTIRDGVKIEQRVEPLASVGCYVPGGRHPLPSTLLMTAIPAAIAGVQQIVVACPTPAPAVLCAALEAGATRVLRIGGAQAVAALAYGTRSIKRVDKIVGPGNAWVAAAKTLVSPDCAVDFHAGPSEIVICSETGRPEWIAADLIAQAEHDPAARAIFITTRARLAARVAHALSTQMPASGPARTALAQNGAIILARNRTTVMELANRLAPEHLVCDSASDVRLFRAAGTIFVGSWSAQASGDYCTGSNHVLPTGGSARFRGGLSAADFVRVFTVQTLTARGLRAIAPSVIALAEAEGLSAHAESIRTRMRSRAGSGRAANQS